MVRLAKLSPINQCSWGPHSLALPIDSPEKPHSPEKAHSFIASTIALTTIQKFKLPEIKAERARKSPYISHMLKRDKEKLLEKLGAIEMPKGSFGLETTLSTMLNELTPLTRGHSRIDLAVEQKIKKNRNKYFRRNSRMKASQNNSVNTTQNWWREDDYLRYNVRNPSISEDGFSYEDGYALQQPDAQFEQLNDELLEELSHTEVDSLMYSGNLEDELVSSGDAKEHKVKFMETDQLIKSSASSERSFSRSNSNTNSNNNSFTTSNSNTTIGNNSLDYY